MFSNVAHKMYSVKSAYNLQENELEKFVAKGKSEINSINLEKVFYETFSNDMSEI